MLRYAVLSIPWGRLAGSALLVAVLVAVAGRWAWAWAMQGVAVGLIAAGAAWCLDEPSAAVVDPTPRPLWWRTVARGIGVAALLGVWSVAVWWVRASLLAHPWQVWLQGVVAAAVATAWTTYRRSAGVPAPGAAFAAAVAPVTTLWALAHPLARHLPVFPPSDEHGGGWSASAVLWGAALAGSALVALGALSDARWWRVARDVDGGERARHDGARGATP